MGRTSEIKITVQLDDDKMPVEIMWEATDAGFKGSKPAKTLMLSLWDENEKMTYSVDLWTKEMLLNNMNVHFHQMFLKMADTFEKATNNTNAANKIREFSKDFADELNLPTVG